MLLALSKATNIEIIVSCVCVLQLAQYVVASANGMQLLCTYIYTVTLVQIC